MSILYLNEAQNTQPMKCFKLLQGNENFPIPLI